MRKLALMWAQKQESPQNLLAEILGARGSGRREFVPGEFLLRLRAVLDARLDAGDFGLQCSELLVMTLRAKVVGT